MVEDRLQELVQQGGVLAVYFRDRKSEEERFWGLQLLNNPFFHKFKKSILDYLGNRVNGKPIEQLQIEYEAGSLWAFVGQHGFVIVMLKTAGNEEDFEGDIIQSFIQRIIK